MSTRNLGAYSGYVAIGEVVDVENDPSQSGRARVRWRTGSATQSQVQDSDLPWTMTMFSSSDPATKQTGGPHTGLRKGSFVVGIPLDGQGQDFMIIGSILAGGEGGVDQPAQFDSDMPQAAKTQQNGGESQRRYGDVNGVVTQESIVKYAEESAGQESRGARFASLDDSIGTLTRIIA